MLRHSLGVGFRAAARGPAPRLALPWPLPRPPPPTRLHHNCALCLRHRVNPVWSGFVARRLLTSRPRPRDIASVPRAGLTVMVRRMRQQPPGYPPGSQMSPYSQLIEVSRFVITMLVTMPFALFISYYSYICECPPVRPSVTSIPPSPASRIFIRTSTFLSSFQ